MKKELIVSYILQYKVYLIHHYLEHHNCPMNLPIIQLQILLYPATSIAPPQAWHSPAFHTQDIVHNRKRCRCQHGQHSRHRHISIDDTSTSTTPVSEYTITLRSDGCGDSLDPSTLGGVCLTCARKPWGDMSSRYLTKRETYFL